MITDKQIEQIFKEIEVPDIDDFYTRFARAIIEAHEQSKWIKFDINDVSTHPQVGQTVNACTNKGNVMAVRFEGLDEEIYTSTGKIVYWYFQGTDDRSYSSFSYWQLLPQVPKELI